MTSVAKDEVAGMEPDRGSAPHLSICIPTYNRREKVVTLAAGLLKVEGPFEICIHVDGATDGTMEALRQLPQARLRLGESPNQGRAGALAAACRAARGRYIMIFDDDDALTPEGLRAVLSDCAAPGDPDCAGYIYHLAGEDGARLGDQFPIQKTNFLALRADFGVRGDKKEVILADRLRSAILDPRGRYRRTPTSLIWSRIALSHSVICRNVVIGGKTYLAGGMTANARNLKIANAYPMMLLYVTHVRGFLRGRYASLLYFLTAVSRLGFYAVMAGAARFRPRT